MSGDHVMGWSTSVIAPPGGNLNDFMASLAKLAKLDLRVMYPAHGWSIDDPQARMEELRAHREQRTTQAIEALAAGLTTIPTMVERIYADVDRRLHPAAARSLLAHLDALVEQRRVRVKVPSADPLAVGYELAR